MSNPLVAQQQDSTTAVSGVSFLEDAQSLKQGIESGDWASTVMGVAGTAMDALAFVTDPFGSILAAGVGWLMEHVGPLKEMLDKLAGDPDQITAHSETWKNIAGELGSVSTDLANQVNADIQSWTGPGADAYRQQAAEVAKVLQGAGEACEGAASGVKTAGEVVAAVRMLVRDTIAQVVGHLVSWALQVLFTLGIGLTWVVPQVVNLVAKTAKDIASLLKNLTKALGELGKLLGKAGDLFKGASKSLKGLKPGKNATTTKVDTLPSGAKNLDPVGDKTTPSGAGNTGKTDGNTTPSGAGDTTPSGSGKSGGGDKFDTTGDSGPSGDGTRGLGDTTTPSGDHRPKDPNDTGTTTPNRDCVTDPIDVGTGEVVLTEVDLELPDPFPLVLERTHISGYRAGRWFGPGWAATVDQRLEVDAEGVCFLTADGAILVYPHPRPGVAVEPVVGPAWPLSQRPDGTYAVAAEGRTLSFGTRSGAAFELDAIIDGDGARIDVERHAEALLLRHSAGYRVELRTARGRVNELHVLNPVHSTEPADVLVVRYGYDDRGRLAELVNSSGLATRFDYDDAGRLTGWQDRTGTWYRYEYDAEGRCVRTIGADGRLSSTFSYDSARRATRFTDSLGHVTEYELNERHQTVRQTDALGHTTAFDWDARHRLLARTDPLGRTTRFEYGADGALAVVVRPDGSRVAVDAGGLDIEVTGEDRVWRRSYDKRPDPFQEPIGVSVTEDLPVTTTVPASEGRAGEVPRDMFGRPTAMPGAAEVGWTIEGKLAWRAAADAREQWRYDPEGNEIEHRDAAGNTRRKQYGRFGLLVAETDPAGARTEYAYDTESRLIGVTNALGQTWRYRYDPVGRLVESTDLDGRRTRFAYDPAGRLVRTVDAAGDIVEYGYDVVGNVVEQRTAAGVTTYAYDPVGQLVSATSPDAELTLTRDGAGRVTSQTVNGRTVTFEYDEATRTVRRRTPSGVDSRTRYAADGALVSLEVGEHVVDPRALDAGRRTERYQLDANGRISEVTRPTDVERYRYDALGNLTTSPLAGLHRYAGTSLVQAGATSYRYDALGRLVHSARLTPDGPREWHYVWGPQDRLLGVTTPDGARWRYRYDPLGRRIAKQRLDAAGAVTEHVEFVWDGPVLIEEIRTGGPATTWVYDGSNRPLAQAETAAQQGIQRFFTIHTDQAGTPVELRDTGGSVAWRSHSTLWGAPRTGAPEFPADTPLRFPGQYHDAETGLHYNVFRYYDPATARYVSPDPLGLAPAPNPVAYVPNPLAAADPLGLTCSNSTGSASAPANPGANTNPHLVNSSGSKGMSDSKFNKDHVIDNPDLDAAANKYLNDGKKKTDSEAMGEHGALEYLRAGSGQQIPGGLHTATDAAPHNLPTNPGQPWSHAVKFSSSGVTDVAHWDGKTLNVVEAKGGGSKLGEREQAYFHQDVTGQQAYDHVTTVQNQKQPWQRMTSTSAIDDLKNQNFKAGDPIPQVFNHNNTGASPVLQQGSQGYLTDIGHTMSKSDLQDGRNLLGRQVLQHQANGTLTYTPVRTQAFDNGDGTFSVDVLAGKAAL